MLVNGCSTSGISTAESSPSSFSQEGVTLMCVNSFQFFSQLYFSIAETVMVSSPTATLVTPLLLLKMDTLYVGQMNLTLSCTSVDASNFASLTMQT